LSFAIAYFLHTSTFQKGLEHTNKLFADGAKSADKKKLMKEQSDLKVGLPSMPRFCLTHPHPPPFLLKGCTFKPKISTKSRRISNRGTAGQQRFDALYEDAAKSRTKLKNAQEESATKGCTFTPDLTKSAQKAKREKEEKSKTSRSQGFERLYEDGKDKAAKHDENEARKIQHELEGCTFAVRACGVEQFSAINPSCLSCGLTAYVFCSLASTSAPSPHHAPRPPKQREGGVSMRGC
jgi:hypothetical protein